jgi:hypothetical protein
MHDLAPPRNALADPWLDLWRDAGAWGFGLMAVGWLRDSRQLRRSWLADLTRTTDSYLRSPAFLELMRWGFAATVRSTSLVPRFPFR